MKLPNPIHPAHLTPAERRTELCRLLALGIVRLRMRENGQQSSKLSALGGESSLDHPLHQSRHATCRKQETA